MNRLFTLLLLVVAVSSAQVRVVASVNKEKIREEVRVDVVVIVIRGV